VGAYAHKIVTNDVYFIAIFYQPISTYVAVINLEITAFQTSPAALQAAAAVEFKTIPTPWVVGKGGYTWTWMRTQTQAIL